jgi:hypothetical protein
VNEKVMNLEVVSAAWTPPAVEPCPAGGPPGLIGQGTPSGFYGFEESLSSIERDDDGVYRFELTENVPVGLAPFTVEYHIAIRVEE